MDIVLACIADNANVTVDGKLNVHGVFDTIYAQQFPAMHLSLALVFRLRTEYEDAQTSREIRVRLIDADHREMWKAEGTFEVTRMIPGTFTHTDQVINLRGATFHRPGRYRFIIELGDGSLSQSVAFQVLPRPAA